MKESFTFQLLLFPLLDLYVYSWRSRINIRIHCFYY